MRRAFIEQIIEDDLENGLDSGKLRFRFPPEPNGYLHIGHTKAICINFGLGEKYNAPVNLRFDDTNPVKEDVEYVDSIKKDIQWLGYQWENELYASDYFEQLYSFAIKMIKEGLAYVDDSTAEEIAVGKGTPTTPGTNSPYRNRSVEENLQLFEGMRNGEYKDGEKVLRAKIDMAAINMHMRDPLMYRIKHAHHHRTGDKWCIYPMYDFAHGQSDAIESITHSLCSLEFVPHRELYDWFIKTLELFPSHQYEFARLNMTYTMMSKRKLLQLVNEGVVDGWDDPRMPTISALRRRGFTPESVREFCNRIGVAKRDNMIDVGLLEFCAREHLNRITERRMVVFDPLKVVITNFPEGETEWVDGENNPEVENPTFRKIPLTREIYIEQEDFMENAPGKYFRMTPGKMVRLKSAYIVNCDSVEKDAEGNITQVNCSLIEDSKSGGANANIKVKGTIHWVSIEHAKKAELRLYDRLFTEPDLDDAPGDFKDYLNPNSLEIIKDAYIEPALLDAKEEDHFQFIRKGYFVLDKKHSEPDKLVFNRTVTLKDSWAKELKKGD
ncbi:MAG: glutamine--tRNA ligase [Pseudopedobacter saltans]|uniref:Glutamine--tRNA ligase n=1 Tax=Pseudopedobacter saltans TaxID=151895 RepID=A0A2W5F5T0_9SPHI|nr:MAG: glutamine--tRNA ligase [Pseudopedobacter saltans]